MKLTKSVQHLLIQPVGRLSRKQQGNLRSARNRRYEADPRVVAQLPVDWDGFEVEVRLGEVNGRLECVGLEIISDPSAPGQTALTSVKLRQLRLGDLVDRARREYRESLEMAARIDMAPGGWSPALSKTERDEIMEAVKADAAARLAGLGSDGTPPRPGRPRLYDREHYKHVARIYQGAMGVRPTTTVAKSFQVSRSAAGKWVAEARSRGLLPPTTKGKASPRH